MEEEADHRTKAKARPKALPLHSTCHQRSAIGETSQITTPRPPVGRVWEAVPIMEEDLIFPLEVGEDVADSAVAWAAVIVQIVSAIRTWAERLEEEVDEEEDIGEDVECYAAGVEVVAVATIPAHLSIITKKNKMGRKVLLLTQ